MTKITESEIQEKVILLRDKLIEIKNREKISTRTLFNR